MNYYQFGTTDFRGDGTLTEVTIAAETLEEANELLQELISRPKYITCRWYLNDFGPYGKNK